MSILSRVGSAARALVHGDRRKQETLSNPGPLLRSTFGWMESASGVAVTEDTAMSVSTVYRCVDLAARSIAKLPVHMHQLSAQGDAQVVTDHPLARLLQSPHPLMDRHSVITALAANLKLRGNAIAVIFRDGLGDPTGMWPIHATQAAIHDISDGSRMYQITACDQQEAAVFGGNWTIWVPEADIFHAKGLTFGGRIGVSPLAVMVDAIGNSLAGQRLAGRLMKNGMKLSGVLVTDEVLDDDVAERMRQQWQEMQSIENAGRTAILENGTDYKALNMTAVDAQLIEQMGLTVEDVARGFGTPMELLGRTQGVTTANFEQILLAYYSLSLQHDIEPLEAEFCRAFRLRPDQFVRFEVDNLFRTDAKTRADISTGLLEAGIITINEARRMHGYPRLPGGDVSKRPLNAAYVDPTGKVAFVTPPGGNKPAAVEGGRADEGSAPSDGQEGSDGPD